MIKEIMRDILFLKKPSIEATKDDLWIAQDLKDTLSFHKDGCVGMAANMIGYSKNIIIIDDDGQYVVMFNPKVLKTFGTMYETEESCLSLEGVRKTKRYPKIKVQWLDENWKIKIKTFEGFQAQIIQHELDHLKGIII